MAFSKHNRTWDSKRSKAHEPPLEGQGASTGLCGHVHLRAKNTGDNPFGKPALSLPLLNRNFALKSLQSCCSKEQNQEKSLRHCKLVSRDTTTQNPRMVGIQKGSLEIILSKSPDKAGFTLSRSHGIVSREVLSISRGYSTQYTSIPIFNPYLWQTFNVRAPDPLKSSKPGPMG